MQNLAVRAREHTENEVFFSEQQMADIDNI